MLYKSTIQLLRLPFSFFLLPVYLFAISEAGAVNTWHAILVFFILHFLVYPASNGYNSYMDRDTESIGGVKNPLQPTPQLFVVSVIMDALAILLSAIIDFELAYGIILYIAVSRAYSYRKIRLKKYPFIGYLTVAVFQGAFTYFLVSEHCDNSISATFPGIPALISSLLIGGFYPLTQVYQHDADLRDGVKTLSYVLGYRGTFIFSGIVYTLAMALLFYHYQEAGTPWKFLLFMVIMAPVPYFFLKWAFSVWKDVSAADFKHTMKMNVVASVCTNAAFLLLMIWRFFE
jgi:1,4-dihydroxy-2-naphthoate octaprenyltransferase